MKNEWLHGLHCLHLPFNIIKELLLVYAIARSQGCYILLIAKYLFTNTCYHGTYFSYYKLPRAPIANSYITCFYWRCQAYSYNTGVSGVNYYLFLLEDGAIDVK